MVATSTRLAPWVAATLLTLGLSSGAGAPAAASASSSVAPSSPCSHANVTSYSHVVWIVLENVGYSVVGSPSAPYLNSLAAKCALATNDVATSHPSLPNYIALLSLIHI